MSFEGKTIIVTGATSGIGRATAEAFGRTRAAVVLVGRNQGALQEVADRLRQDGARPAVCAADVTTAGAPDQIIRAALDLGGGIDVLVNAAGVIASGTLDATTDAVWDAMMAVNVTAPFRLMRAAASNLIARKGSVVNVS